MEVKNTTLPLITMVEYIRKGRILLNKFLEKNSLPHFEKEKTIYWLLNGFPIPNNVVIDNYGNVINGKETIEIINDFLNDRLEIKDVMFDKIKKDFLENLDKNFNKNSIKFSDFSIEIQEMINNFQITYTVVYFPTFQELEEYKKLIKQNS